MAEGMTSRSPSPDSARKLTPRQRERRDRILSSARALLAEQGYDAVTMRAIALASGAVEKTLFNIFGNKDRLMAAAAFERSVGVFDHAGERSAEPGWPRLMALCDVVAEVTLEAPEMARGLAVPVLEHFELVGLDRLYDRYVGEALAAMVEAGQLAPGTPRAPLTHIIQLGVVSSVVFWAKDELKDAGLRPFLRLRMNESLLPHARAGFAPRIKREIHAMLGRLGSRGGET